MSGEGSDMSKSPPLRCKECGKLLGKGIVERGIVEIKCPRCGAYNIFQIGNFDPIEIPREIK